MISARPLNTDMTNISAAVPTDRPAIDILEMMLIALTLFLLKTYRHAIKKGNFIWTFGVL
jgi:hypothetical protein